MNKVSLSISAEKKDRFKNFEVVGPKQTDVLLKNQLEIRKVLEEEEYTKLANTVHNRKS